MGGPVVPGAGLDPAEGAGGGDELAPAPEPAGGSRPKKRPFLSPPKLVNTSSTRALRACASAMIRRPRSLEIRLYPGSRASIAPLRRADTENIASVVSGASARYVAIASVTCQ